MCASVDLFLWYLKYDVFCEQTWNNAHATVSRKDSQFENILEIICHSLHRNFFENSCLYTKWRYRQKQNFKDFLSWDKNCVLNICNNRYTWISLTVKKHNNTLRNSTQFDLLVVGLTELHGRNKYQSDRRGKLTINVDFVIYSSNLFSA